MQPPLPKYAPKLTMRTYNVTEKKLPKRFPVLQEDGGVIVNLWIPGLAVTVPVEPYLEGNMALPNGTWACMIFYPVWHSNWLHIMRETGGSPPEEVRDLYHPVTQLRLALGSPAGVETLKTALTAWQEHWATKTAST